MRPGSADLPTKFARMHADAPGAIIAPIARYIFNQYFALCTASTGLNAAGIVDPLRRCARSALSNTTRPLPKGGAKGACGFRRPRAGVFQEGTERTGCGVANARRATWATQLGRRLDRVARWLPQLAVYPAVSPFPFSTRSRRSNADDPPRKRKSLTNFGQSSFSEDVCFRIPVRPFSSLLFSRADRIFG